MEEEGQRLTWAEGIALKVKALLDNTGPSNMPFTDGPSDKNVSQFFSTSIKIRFNS